MYDFIDMKYGLPTWHSAKESTCQCRRHKRLRFNAWVRKIPWSRKWQPTPVSLPKIFHRQRSLTGYSLWGRKEVDTTERLSTNAQARYLLGFLFSFTFSHMSSWFNSDYAFSAGLPEVWCGCPSLCLTSGPRRSPCSVVSSGNHLGSYHGPAV